MGGYDNGNYRDDECNNRDATYLAAHLGRIRDAEAPLQPNLFGRLRRGLGRARSDEATLLRMARCRHAVIENVTSASISRLNSLPRRVLKTSRLISITLRFPCTKVVWKHLERFF
jgi:hypothetical protein